MSTRVQATELREIAASLRLAAKNGRGVVEYSFGNKRVRKEGISTLLEEARKLEREADILEGYYGANLAPTQLIWRR